MSDEASINSLLQNPNYQGKQLQDIFDIVVKVCARLDISLDFSKYEGQRVGLIYNIPFVKKSK